MITYQYWYVPLVLTIFLFVLIVRIALKQLRLKSKVLRVQKHLNSLPKFSKSTSDSQRSQDLISVTAAKAARKAYLDGRKHQRKIKQRSLVKRLNNLNSSESE